VSFVVQPGFSPKPGGWDIHNDATISLAIHINSQYCIFSARPPEHSTCLHQNGHSGCPQGKTGIIQTEARAGKNEIPALRFAWPE